MTNKVAPESNQMTSRRGLWIMKFLLVFIILVAVIVLSKRSPAWFHPQFTTDAQMENRSANFEQGLAAQFTKVRGQDSVWAIRITETEMNEWLASRLPKWLEHQGKSPASCNNKVQVRCLEERIDIAAENSWGVGVIQITPKMQPATTGNATLATLNMSPTSAAIGTLSIPVFLISTFGPTDMFESLHKSEFSLADGRRVQVKDIEVLPGEIRMQLETSPTKN
jgi:hypothetical protein